MRTTICTLRHAGRTATARVSTASPQEKGEVSYEGDVELFTQRFARLSNPTLTQMALMIASETGAESQVEDTGFYDWWAV